jgi:hypothetical protein
MDSGKQKLQLVQDGSELAKEDKLKTSRPIRPTEESHQEAHRRVKRRHLINKLNYINFQDRNILISFKHFRYDHTIRIEAKPMPCQDEILQCCWADTSDLKMLSRYYSFDSLLVPDGQQVLQVAAELARLDGEGAEFKLPEVCLEICARKVTRHRCQEIQAQLIQNGTIFKGSLLDFNAVSFRVQVTSTPPQTFQWLNSETPITVLLTNQSETFFAGDCRILHQTRGQKTREYVFEPVRNEIHRFEHKEFRSARQRVSPSPDIVFAHPFTGKMITLKAIDLSGSGFAVEEDAHHSVLLPGLMIPELEISFANSLRLKCKAQVVYRQKAKSGLEKSSIRCGLALLDMDIEKHVQFVALLQQAEDQHSYVCNKVEMDDLWDFFFETGFIYPNKYEYIQRNKEQIKETYEKLYTRNPNIARHFIYQDKGKILGHMAMLRFYDNAWLIHHHASRNSEYNRAGLMVLNQIGRFNTDSHRLYSLHMDFVMCYYRPENKFPNRVFGGAYRNIRNRKICSQDQFAYFHINARDSLPEGDTHQWELSLARNEDLRELASFYNHESGGLMINALNLEPGNTDQSELAQEYQKLGFKRERYVYALKRFGNLKAILIINLSDVGLNLSDLTNCLQVMVIDSQNLSSSILIRTIRTLMQQHGQESMPVLLFPVEYALAVSLPLDKKYNLWVMSPQYSDDYFRYLSRLLRFVKR